ncbi:hypothetical protein RIEGSTA812A_PEG_747 [invertebrate metagenome]|uniref:Uncharacterized protein n=1 Tax=invertebrate metagenome TaxID=1711999 RepID=A0A484H6P6_9ZZZZ
MFILMLVHLAGDSAVQMSWSVQQGVPTPKKMLEVTLRTLKV